ncbi:pyrroline-5-carboxylate reductase [Histidinibacterium lentulum]|uniref:Pyrroline-5-carboxylate reductase n=1 Tax=Histidinibacterium lentulum TaxID=2480588 RepID=A0A3N2QUZ8_9RHOB|nr:pyrroline-5-carboxylate reductase [Histidinibacterium lentulum]ROT99026.1 pyrroline-5-carboxylate reductase [Histidinibacterium lentulum]
MTGLQDIADRGLVLLGCGKMGSAMLAGWLDRGVPPEAVHVIEPAPSDWLRGSGVGIGGDLPERPAVLLVAVKPQMMEEALPGAAGFGGGGTLVISVAAGTPLARFEAAFGPGTPVVRAMPNTPAAVGRGITAIVGNAAAGAGHLDLAEALLKAVGQVVRLEGEGQMDAVTAVSGSGPAYVFHLIETLAAAGEAEGLSPELAMALARATVGGAGQLAEDAAEDPGQLRRNVTSPNGTTQAALEVLMDAESGFPALLRRAVHAAAERSRELGRG